MLIAIENIAPGMKISKDIFSPEGEKLASAGTILTEKHVTLLKKRGIVSIPVDSTQPPAPAVHPSASQKSPIPNNSTPPPLKTHDPLPSLKVSIEKNGLSAFLEIKPLTPHDSDLTVEILTQELNKAGVIAGINESIVREAVIKWNENKQPYEFADIASGIEPMGGQEEKLQILVDHANCAKEVEIIERATHCWQLLNTGIPIQRVDPGMTIASIGFTSEEITGMTVTGEELKPQPARKMEIILDEHVEPSKDKRSFKSLKTGLVYYFNNTLGVLPISFDGSAEIVVAEDKMEASLIVHPPVNGGLIPSEKSIHDLIASKKIVSPIDTTALQALFGQLRTGLIPEAPLCISRGIPPQNGDDGYIKFLFDTETSLKPKEDHSGNVDFKEINIIHAVKKGDELAVLMPPTKGKPGRDLFGKEIPAQNGAPALLPIGPNTDKKESDPSVLISLLDGNVRLNGHKVEVYEGFFVKGDVNFGTGNINYPKSIMVGGDVKSGFSVSTESDLEVSGTIEDAHLKIGGTVLCKRGFIGQGKGLLECAGDVNVGFMKNQTIRSRGTVTIAKEAINCTIFCAKKIIVNGRNLSVAGGRLLAKDSITVMVAGNQSEVQTILEVGYDYKLLDELSTLEKKSEETAVTRGKLLESIRRTEKIMSTRRTVSPQESMQYKKLQQATQLCDHQLKAFEEEKKKLIMQMHDCRNATIRIERSAFPGTMFKFGDRHFIVKEEIKGPKTVRLVNFEIALI